MTPPIRVICLLLNTMWEDIILFLCLSFLLYYIIRLLLLFKKRALTKDKFSKITRTTIAIFLIFQILIAIIFISYGYRIEGFKEGGCEISDIKLFREKCKQNDDCKDDYMRSCDSGRCMLQY